MSKHSRVGTGLWGGLWALLRFTWTFPQCTRMFFYLTTDTINAKQIACIITHICTVPSVAADVTCYFPLFFSADKSLFYLFATLFVALLTHCARYTSNTCFIATDVLLQMGKERYPAEFTLPTPWNTTINYSLPSILITLSLQGNQSSTYHSQKRIITYHVLINQHSVYFNFPIFSW